MSLVKDAVFGAIGKRVPKVIGPAAHGLIDYGHVAFFLGMALLLRKSNKRAAMAALGTGALVLVQSVLTDYPMGVVPAMSFETHGKLDAAMAASSWAIPGAFGFAGTPAAKIFTGNSVLEGAIVKMTDFSVPTSADERATEF